MCARVYVGVRWGGGLLRDCERNGDRFVSLSAPNTASQPPKVCFHTLHSELCYLTGKFHEKGSRNISVGTAPDSFMIERSQVRVPASEAGEFSSPCSTFRAESYFSIHSTPVLPQQHVKDPSHYAKSAGGRLQLNTHAPDVRGFA